MAPQKKNLWEPRFVLMKKIVPALNRGLSEVKIAFIIAHKEIM